MYAEEDFVPVAALNHLVYCERRCALMYIEDIWDENRFTVEGTQLHEQVHQMDSETRGDVRIVRGLLLRSVKHGLTGKADVVEFHRLKPQEAGARLPGVSGIWRPFPIEYKLGKPKPEPCDEVQLCAQALCIEEMLGARVTSGAIFYGRPRRRQEVLLDESLRRETEALAARLHELLRAGKTPTARYEKKCRNCSLFSLCMPKATGSRRSVERYLSDAITESVRSFGGDEP